MEEFIFRKSEEDDALKMAKLLTELLGTCDVTKSKYDTSEKILQRNLLHIKNNIKNYYVCSFKNEIIGACGISEIMHENIYDIQDLPSYREILYLVVDKNFQRKGIGKELLKLTCQNIKEPIIYEAWGDGEYVNSKFLLEKCNFKFLKDLGNTYYKDNGYCKSCVNRNKKCFSCHAEVWIKN